MNELELIISLLPIIFMIHEFEEIICFKSWVVKNGLWFTRTYPKFAKQIAYLRQLPVPGFALAVLEEFVLVSIITVLALTVRLYSVWIAAFTAFVFHIFLHMFQWMLIRKYIPVIITSFLSLPYLVWGLNKVLSSFSASMIVPCFAMGTVTAILNLYFIHTCALQYIKIIKNDVIQLIDRKGNVRKGKRVVVTTTFCCNIDEVWQRIQNVSTLVEICKPMARFTPRKGEMPMNWIIGKTYEFNLYFHCILPMGKHTIMIESMNGQNHEIQSREYNTLVPVWNHLIKIQPSTDGKVSYTDEIDLYAGCFTNFVAWWASHFYRHRQKRWKLILGK